MPTTLLANQENALRNERIPKPQLQFTEKSREGY